LVIIDNCFVQLSIVTSVIHCVQLHSGPLTNPWIFHVKFYL